MFDSSWNRRGSSIVLIIAIVASILCFLPFYGYKLLPLDSEMNFMDSFTFRQSALSTLIIVIPTSMDIILDLLHLIGTALTTRKNGMIIKTKAPVVIVRLTSVERSLFVFGIAIRCLVIFVPLEEDYLPVLFYCCSNCTTVLTICPIIMFLERCTTTWNSKITITMALLAALGAVFGSTSYCLHKGTLAQKNISLAGTIFLYLDAIIFGILCGKCFYLYIEQKRREGYFRFLKWHIKSSLFKKTKPFIKSLLDGGLKKEIEIVDDMYQNYIPAAHLISGLLFVVSHAWLTPVSKTYSAGDKNFVLISIAVLVLVVEIRVRKNEVERGLTSIGFKNALLDSKKSYVRYISHELRTPLNTAYLGLKLLSDEVKESCDPLDIDRLDTLSDVSAACKTAVDILNDLLCFDMLESGILELHKQEVPILSFLNENMKLFTTQAKIGGVDLSLSAGVIDFDSNNAGQNQLLAGSWVARPIHKDDSINFDRFKMDQVIRNLISNALKFTPKGGFIKITATFIPDYIETASRNVSVGSGSNDSSSKSGFTLGKSQKKRLGIHKYSFRRIFFGVDTDDFNDEGRPGRIETVGGYLVIVVKDSGVGVSESNQKRLFNEIVQFNPEILQAGGGSGLGLWITRGIVDLHDSIISVFSEGEGRGTTFTLKIPMNRKCFTPDGCGDYQGTVGIKGAARRASFCQDEEMSFRREGSWKYILKHLGPKKGNSNKDLNKNTPIQSRNSSQNPSLMLPLSEKVENSSGTEDVKNEAKCVLSDFSSDSAEGYFMGDRNNQLPFQNQSQRTEKTEITGLQNPSKSTYEYDSPPHPDKRPPQVLKLKPTAQQHQPNKYFGPKKVLPEDLKYHILVVDDSKLNRKMLCKVLRSKGHNTEEAEDGVLAVKKVITKMNSEDGTTNFFDAILMDFVMPNMDGPTATKKIRDLGYISPIIGVTGNSLPSDILHFKEHGADFVLIKPLDISDFNAAMNDMKELTVESLDLASAEQRL